MKLGKSLCSLLLLIIIPHAVLAQKGHNYDYAFPIRPGERNYLSGTMGELRASHFHAGIDIKTGGIEGYPVYAAKEGYISRIRISTGGYGNCLYMMHPNGHTTVYAHLSDFHPAIAEKVKEVQYKQREFEVEIFPDKDEFYYNKKDQIGWSGNSGSSGGPHLHFEIRDPYQRILNPLQYGFNEIKDNIPPIAKILSIKAIDAESRVNGQFSRKEFNLTRQGNTYIYNQPIEVYGKVGIELYAYDVLDGAANRNGISSIKVYKDDELYFHQQIDTMSFALQRHIMVHYDHEVRRKTGLRYHRLYIADGNELKFYRKAENKGYMTFAANEDANIRIEMKDPYGNQSQVQFRLKGQNPIAKINSALPRIIDQIDFEVVNNHFLMVYSQDSCQKATFYHRPRSTSLYPAYSLKNAHVYIWDLRNGLADSVSLCGRNLKFDFVSTILPQRSISVYDKNITYEFNKNTLFDTLHLQSSYTTTEHDDLEIFSIGNMNTPLKGSIDITLTPRLKYEVSHEKLAAYSVDDTGNFNFAGGKQEGNTFKFTTREMGNYTLLADTVPPTIHPIEMRPTSLSFRIFDELSGIRSYEMKVAGQWILMRYEPKQQLIWSDFPKDVKQLSGEVELRVTDNAGNIQLFSTKI